ncbi:cyanophycinase [Deinococcus indicus]|uniref:Cyanophycinase n=1 Tax=Deinococcus indicus TaxID=223556 RepID=A0A246BJK9_9DEIO|nr:cyanophycinase [Deinococcus indicus]OWL95485.1 cyanophycinase [Deinococcus indicus]
MRKRTLTLAFTLASLTLSGASQAARGHLLIVGGGLRSDNAPVYDAFLQAAGGRTAAKVVIVPTASSSLSSSRRFKEDLEALGVPADRVTILDITSKNADSAVKAPEVLNAINAATAVWLVGGDQLRLQKAFVNPDGSDTPALKDIRALWAERGGVIGGTSAGASIQSVIMPSAFGVPMDSLDFGVAPLADQRGVSLSPGFGLFSAGIVDQHFNTYAGRHARMATYLTAGATKIGFGLDENTAMLVTPDGMVEVLGSGGLSIMDARAATREAGPLGVHLGNLRLHYLMSGDRVNPATLAVTVNPKKSLIKPGDEYEATPRTSTDLAGNDAFRTLLTYGLVDNTATQTSGLYLRFRPGTTYGYGYRVTLSKTADTQGHYGSVTGVDAYTVLNARMDVAPVSLGGQAPTAPRDLRGHSREAELTTVAFRGLLPPLPSGLFAPQRSVTRAELAAALVFASGAGEKTVPDLSDVPATHADAAAIRVATSRGWLTAPGGRFEPDRPATREETALALAGAYDFVQLRALPASPLGATDAGTATTDAGRQALGAAIAAGLLDLRASAARPAEPVTRAELGAALYTLMGFQF